MHNIAICKQCIFSFQKSSCQFKKINYDCNVNFRISKVSNYFSLKDVAHLTLRDNVLNGLVIRSSLALVRQKDI